MSLQTMASGLQGWMHLSSTTLAVDQYMVNFGSTDAAYTATHNLSLYRYQSSGSIVFGAGTVFWASFWIPITTSN